MTDHPRTQLTDLHPCRTPSPLTATSSAQEPARRGDAEQWSRRHNGITNTVPAY